MIYASYVYIGYMCVFRFPVDDNSTMKSVVEYFQEMYGFTIQLTHLPCLQVGNQTKANYLPMEVRKASGNWRCYIHIKKFVKSYVLLVLQACKIVEGQRYTKRLNEKQITALLKVTCQRPRDRENDILRVGIQYWALLLEELVITLVFKYNVIILSFAVIGEEWSKIKFWQNYPKSNSN